MGRLDGKTAIVTGGASGFGEEVVRQYVAEGAKVAILDLNGEGAQAVASELGNAASAFTCDVSKGDQVRDTVGEVIRAFGEVDILINNAGWTHRNQPLLDVTEEEFDMVYDINVKSIFHFTRAIVPHWRAIGRGVMLNIGSTAGLRPRPGLTWYNSTKGAVHLMSRSLAGELAGENIRVNVIAPVMGATALLERFMGVEDTPENRAKFVSTIPMGRMCAPRDIANAAIYLGSDEASFVTGTVLEVDGGRTV